MIKKGGSEAPEGTRELSQNGITAKIVQERWGGSGGNTVLYVNLLLTKSNANAKPTRKSISTSENIPMERFYKLGAMAFKDKVQNLEVIGLEMNTTFNFHLPS